MIYIVDSDSIVYSAACSVEKRYYLSHHDCNEYQYKKDVPHIGEGFDLCYDVGELWMAKANANNLLKKIVEQSDCDEFFLYLTGPDNFRYEVCPDYKGNRKDLRRPEHLEAIVEHLEECWGAEVVHGIEADDKCSIEAYKLSREGYEVLIAHIDKDLNQIPGWHYNWVKNKRYYVSEEEANRYYWTQVLTGDVGDNIPGIQRIGPVKAAKILAGASTPQDMEDKVKEAYLLDGRKRKISDSVILERMEKTKKLLKLLR